MSSVTTLDSVPLFHLVAQHLYAVELSRAAQVSKALREASDSDESWTVSYGVSKAYRKQMVDADKAEVTRVAEEHRNAILVLYSAKENVSTLTNQLAQGAVFLEGRGGNTPELFLRYTGHNGVYFGYKHAAALSWETCPSTSLMYQHSLLADLRDATREEAMCREQFRFLANKLQLNIATLRRPPRNPFF